MKDMMILKDGTAIELEAAASIGAMQVLSKDRTSMAATWSMLTDSKLKAVQIRNGEGLVRGNYTDLLLASETSVVQPDGSILTTYSLRPKTEMEKVMERLAAVEAGQYVQDGAIADLGEVASVLSEQMEGGVQ